MSFRPDLSRVMAGVTIALIVFGLPAIALCALIFGK